jgi:asparagine synthase (glutamine-hydrolysing)
MCGIAGVLALSAEKRDLGKSLASIVEHMSERIAHRGPDGSGLWSSSSGTVVLAHRRLAIIDLSEGGRQPMSYAEGRYHITFNGEIYNYRELAAELVAYGHRLRSGSDTEVLLAAVAQWGIRAALKRLVGMFAFALWDEHERVLHMARDRLGEKPLYLGEVNGYLFFSSELRAFRAIPGFRAALSDTAVAAYLRDGCVPGLPSIYEGVYKLGPGQVVTVRAQSSQRLGKGWLGATGGNNSQGERELRPSEYWSCSDVAARAQDAIIMDEAAASKELERLLLESVRLQMHADVPTGAFLSGGIDSTLVTALVQAQSSQPVHTFTVAFDDPRFDESRHARAIASHLGTRHEEFVLREGDIVRQVPELLRAMDEPTANGSFFPVCLISRLAAAKVKVVLSGDGGDEFYAGYNRYALAGRVWSALGWLPQAQRLALARMLDSGSTSAAGDARGLVGRFTRLGTQVGSAAALAKVARMLRASHFAEAYQQLTYCWGAAPFLDEERARYSPRPWRGARLQGRLSQMLLADQLDYLPDDSLAKVDRASMAASLETRLPLLDHRLVEFSWLLPERLKLRGGVTKRVLRKVLYRYVPRELIERPKMGFSVPVDAWLRGPLRDWAGDLLHGRQFNESLPWRSGAMARLWQDYSQRRCAVSGYQIWALVMLAGWQRSASEQQEVVASVAKLAPSFG